MADFVKIVEFSAQDVVEAVDTYSEMIDMAMMRVEYLKKFKIKEPLDKLLLEIQKDAISEVIRIGEMIHNCNELLSQYLKDEGIRKGGGNA